MLKSFPQVPIERRSRSGEAHGGHHDLYTCHVDKVVTEQESCKGGMTRTIAIPAKYLSESLRSPVRVHGMKASDKRETGIRKGAKQAGMAHDWLSLQGSASERGVTSCVCGGISGVDPGLSPIFSCLVFRRCYQIV